MYAWLENIDLSKFSVPIGDFANQLIDPAMLAIPSDSVFISYRDPQRLRLMSASSLVEMVKQMDESRAFVEKAPHDKSTIALVVNSSDIDETEKALKNILRVLVDKGMDRGQIRMVCNVINFGAIQAINAERTDEKLSAGIISDIKKMLGTDNAHLLDTYITILKSPSTRSGFRGLPQCLEDLITQQQVELETQRKKLRDGKGDDLKAQEVICPITHHVIDVARSRVNQEHAAQFMMLIVALARLAKVKHSELEEFISSQDGDYVNTCYEGLQHYVINPKQSMFTNEQHELLSQLGMGIVVQQWQINEALLHSVSAIENNGNLDRDAPLNASEMPHNLSGQAFRFFGLQKQVEAQSGQVIQYTPSGTREQNI